MKFYMGCHSSLIDWSQPVIVIFFCVCFQILFLNYSYIRESTSEKILREIQTLNIKTKICLKIIYSKTFKFYESFSDEEILFIHIPRQSSIKIYCQKQFFIFIFPIFFWIDSIEERRDIQIFSVSNLKCEIVLRLLRISTKWI